ncbi:hypothetical protein CDA63_11835 [Hymenobacter amundsenii]|uniref:Uncharacterized protein n=1 Tax=Hymenobacter amundsenii TaxID=2006685 RepID=A0A246FK18_9BACT|nr:hypothetical protein [Hymenobacter amundsenii]OWP62902.1 hypothetical protein CDA63_11835 [Hymenobacter amundsenii]
MAGYPLANGFNVTVQQHLDRERYPVATFSLLDALIPRILPGHVCYVQDEDQHYSLTPGLNWRALGSGGGSAQPEGQVTVLADVAILVGQLVARSATGIYPYSAANLAHRHALLGVALSSASAGTAVRVQTEGLATIPGWGLVTGTTYRAGNGGALATASAGLAFSQIIGRAVTADSLLFQPQSIIKLS